MDARSHEVLQKRKLNAVQFRLLISLVLCSFGSAGQPLTGAWKLKTTDGSEVIKIYGTNYFMAGACTAQGQFLYAYGGRYSLAGDTYTETYDFFTADSALVGKSHTFNIRLKKETMHLTFGNEKAEWMKIDNSATALTGTWRFAARVDESGVAGERRSADSPRQTIKILSGKYFQWAAFNRETKQFMGTGGGTYLLAGGSYTENIRFFSRDNTRSGMSLTFDCRLEVTDWYHKGKGTTGNTVSEVWERLTK